MVPIRKSSDLYSASLSIFALMLLLAACGDAPSEEGAPKPSGTPAAQTASVSPTSTPGTSPTPQPTAGPKASGGASPAVSEPSPAAASASPGTAPTSSASSTTLPDRAQFLAIIRKLERTNLEIMAVAEQKALKQPAPTFAQLKGELLNYNSEQALQHWETMYEKDPGWIMEPQGLVFAGEHAMLASSFTVEPQSDSKVLLHFKTFGNISYTRAHQVDYTLVRGGNGDWIIDALHVSTLLNGFSREEAIEAAKTEFGRSVILEKEDETYYYLKVGQSENERYVFHKKDGYTDLAPST
ncbi:hypothetical protein ABE504_21830 [Paenibacillus oryzisoli]|uniref:hypothetical protein n=1 Tax=Paenibacillus oryzisoli TaxID=1850517 RepID=UPI003D26EF12